MNRYRIAPRKSKTEKLRVEREGERLKGRVKPNRTVQKKHALMKKVTQLENQLKRQNLIKKRLVSEMEKEARNVSMVSMYRQGMTLQEIGDRYGLTRERVRQIVSREGITSKEGGKTVQVKEKKMIQSVIDGEERKKRQAVKNVKHAQWVVEHLGDTIETIEAAGLPHTRESLVCKSYVAIRMAHFYQNQKTYLRYLDWVKIWEDSGHFSRISGPNRGWCLVRQDNHQPWSPENAKIIRFGTWLKGRPSNKKKQNIS